MGFDLSSSAKNQMKYGIEDIRSQFPLLADETVIFLNSSFLQPMNLIVSGAIERYVKDGLHEPNPKPKWNAECENVRLKTAKFINAQSEDIVFTRDTTESCNLFQRSLEFKPGDNVVLLRNDYPSQAAGWLELKSRGLEIRYIEMGESGPQPYDADAFRDVVDEHTIAIGLSSIMFDSGLRHDVRSICNTYRPRGVHVLVDATQEVGFGKIDVRELGVSALAFSVQKGLSCPTGLGVLYIDPQVLPDLKLTPPIMTPSSLNSTQGGSSVTGCKSARSLEHNNKALMQCLALGEYLDFLDTVGITKIQTHLESLSLYLRLQLKGLGVETIGPDDQKYRSPHSNVIKLHSEWLPFFVDNHVYVSQYGFGVRVSFGAYNTKSDVDMFVAVIRKGLGRGLTQTSHSRS